MTVRNIKDVVEEINASIGIMEDELELVRSLLKVVRMMVYKEDETDNDND